MPFASHRLRSVDSPIEFRWMNAVKGRMESGRTFVRNAASSSNFGGRAHATWILGCRCGLARVTYDRLMASDRFLRKQILSEVQWCLNARISAGGNFAYQVVSGSNPVNLFERDDRAEASLFAREISLSWQFA